MGSGRSALERKVGARPSEFTMDSRTAEYDMHKAFMVCFLLKII
jgi:hypothetical protein